MKSIVLILSSMLFTINVSAQDCIITLMVSETTRSWAGPTGKPIQFKITLKDTVLISQPNGILKINKAYFKKKQHEQVISFDFFNRLDLEYYREPMFTRTRRTLGEYCGLVLAAPPRD